MSVQLGSLVGFSTESSAKMDRDTDRPCYPLHHSVKDRLHKQYVDFYNTYVLHAHQSHLIPISESRKTNVIFGGTPLLTVGRTEDLYIKRQETSGDDILVRCFVPEGDAPVNGWPVMLYIHGGGWVLGNIDSENHIATNLCVRGHCIVITPEYRLAPENPFPAGLHDCWETLLWAAGAATKAFKLDPTKIAVGGCSAGANLAAAIINKSLSHEPRLRISAQLLLVPVLDNTAHPCNNATWKLNEYTAALPSIKMLWYRDHYLPYAQDRFNPDASPIFFIAPERLSGKVDGTDGEKNTEHSLSMARMPPTTIIIAGMDVLRQEAEDYGKILLSHNVPTAVHIMEGMPHPFIALDGILEDGRKAITVLCEELERVFLENEKS